VHSNCAECRYYTNFKWPYFRTAWGYSLMVGQAGSSIYILHITMWPWPDPRSRSRSLIFCSSENCAFLRVPPPLFWRRAQNWWLITITWDLVYRFSEPDFWISPPVGCHVTSKFAKCWYHQNPLRFISALAEARSLRLWLQVGRHKQCMLAAMTVSPLPGLFFQDGGRPPSWICDARVCTTEEGNLVFFVTVQI